MAEEAQPNEAHKKTFEVVDGEGCELHPPINPLGEVFIDLRNTPKRDLLEPLTEALGSAVGFNSANRYNHVYPLATLGKFAGAVRHQFEEYSITDDGGLLALIEAYEAKRREQVQGNLDNGLVEFDDVPIVYETGSEVVTWIDGQKLGGVVESVERQQSFFGTWQAVKIKVIHNVQGVLDEGLFSARIYAFAGSHSIGKLAVRFATELDKAELVERGKIFRSCASKASYVQYTGHLDRHNWSGSRAYRSTGRAMVDGATFMQTDHNQWSNEQQASGIVVDRQRRSSESVRDQLTIEDADLWRTYPFMYGFSFASKQWGRFYVENISDINWRENAFDQLVLDNELKELIRALVEHHEGSFADIVEGKGGGVIFLLHGPPGEGKTLTAETIAELLKKPLYSVSVGELGVEPDSLEKRLRVILDIATVWDAVILIDEADIFLEERDEHNIVRNAMVGVFLRLLEYHQGVLFLTTNRVKQIDRAFHSRISITIRFKAGDDDKRQKIWSNLTTAAELEGVDGDRLAHHPLNGRQIKNALRISQTLARSRQESVSQEIVERVIRLAARFNEKEE